VNQERPGQAAEYANQTEFSPELTRLHAAIADRSYLAGWNRAGNPPMWGSPKRAFADAHWRFDDARRLLSAAGGLVSPELAERRNLILQNPFPGNRYPTLRTQVIAYQMMLPGERARTHRHAPHAGRVILEADAGAYTVVDGLKIPLRVGDVVLTPGWAWHGHGHDGSQPAFWIDFLDIPLVQLLDAMFFQPYQDGFQEPTAESRDTPLLFPYEQVSKILDEMDPADGGPLGRSLQLGDASSPVPTIGLRMHRLTPGAPPRTFQSTANYQYCVVEGAGTSWVNGVRFDWSRGDVIAVPCWSPQSHSSPAGATVLEVSDEPLQRFCGYFRTSLDIDRGDGRHRGQLPPALVSGADGSMIRFPGS
jgi:gentisate 1,2-dioxygenase